MLSLADKAQVQGNLRKHVTELSVRIGERHMWRPGSLGRAADYIESQFLSAGYAPERQLYKAYGLPVCNLFVELPGASHETVVVGAHYDSVPGSPGADDNASAVAGLLELARLLKKRPGRRRFCFVAFVNEESPAFGSDYMGSEQFARRLKAAGTHVAFMVCLEMIGLFDKHRPQNYPLRVMRRFYPKRADFIAVVANFEAAGIAMSLARRMRRARSVPVRTLLAPLAFGGIDRSDHSAFWRHGYKAVMITDTAQYRNVNYHRESDTVATLNFAAMSGVVAALCHALQDP